MRIAFLIDSLGAGGSERSLADMLPHLVEGGVEPRVFVLREPAQGFAERVRGLGIEVEVVAGSSWWRRWSQLRRELRGWRPALLHTTLFYSDVLGRLAAWGTGVPVLSSLVSVRYDPARLSDPRIRRWRFKVVQLIDGFTGRALTAHYHSVSEAAKASAVRHLGLPPESITVVRRGRDLERLSPPSEAARAEARRRWGVGDDEVLLVNVGRQTFHKAQLVLLRATGELIREGLPVRLVVAGSRGPCSDELREFVAEHDLGERIAVPGHVDDVAELLGAADVFAFPSRLEGFPGAVLEALATGLPVVAAAIPAVREIFPEPSEALLVTPDSPAELARALRELVNDPERRAALGRRGRQLFVGRFDVRDSSAAMLELYRDVANGRRS